MSNTCDLFPFSAVCRTIFERFRAAYGKFPAPTPKIGWEAMTSTPPARWTIARPGLSLWDWERVMYRSNALSPTDGIASTITARATAPRTYMGTIRQPNRAANRGTNMASRGVATSAMSPVRDSVANIP